ncbi:MAG: hypothetical protein GX654_08375 [Desulfatiglans sp.]|nr:hypothetical protein [Desulfatiglans sp.]
MVKNILIFFLLFSNTMVAGEHVKIELENENNNLRICLINISFEKLLINKMLRLGASHESCEIILDILDMEGVEYPFSASVHRRSISEQDIVVLWPGDIIGREYKISELVKIYPLLAPGKYKAKATYKNKDEFGASKGVYDKMLTSNWLMFEIKDTDMVNAFGENWKEVKQNYLIKKKEVEERAKMLDEKYK